MILAAVRDPFLLHSVRRAALPAEDVFSSENDVSDALQLGFPRVAVIERGIEGEVEGMLRTRGSDLPVLELATLDLPGLKRSPSAIAIQRIDTAPARMRQLINEAALPVDWVEGLLRDLGWAAGHALPPELSALGRRTLEFPSRYGPPRRGGRGGRAHAGSAQGAIPTAGLAVALRIHDSITGAVCQRTAEPARYNHRQGRISFGLLE